MTGSVQRFTYTSDRSTYVSTVTVFGAMMLIEGAIFGLLIGLLVPAPYKAILLGLLAIPILYGFWYMYAPLRTHHAISSDRLILRYGANFRTAIPRSSIVQAQPVHEKIESLQATGAAYDAKRRRVVAAFSGKGQVLIRLDRPYPMRIGWFGGGVVEQILINLDKPDEFLAALGVADAQTPEPAPARPAIEVRKVRAEGQPAQAATSFSGEPVIRTEGLTRKYNDFTAVNHLDLSVRPGEIYGFLGANGAGKTTTIKMLVGLMEPSSGRAWIDGHDVWARPLAAKAAMGYVADRSTLYERLTGREFLFFLAQMRGLAQHEVEGRINSLLELLELTNRADDLSRIYSFGMKRKLALAGALLHRPKVLILDEPLNGLDPRSARNLKDFFRQIALEGFSIFLSIHDLAMAEEVCHRVGIINRGSLVAEGTAAELRQLASAPNLEAVFLQLTSEQRSEVTP